MSCLWNSFLEFVSLLIVRFHNIFCDDLPYWKSIFLLVIVLRLLFHCYIYFTRAKPHPTRPVLLMPKPEVIIYTSRHHILSPLELNFSMNHPIYQVNCMLFTFSISCLTFFTICEGHYWNVHIFDFRVPRNFLCNDVRHKSLYKVSKTHLI